jgi:hypothetical protein
MILKYVNRFKWLCGNCKSCQQCGNNNPSMRLLRCNTCDRTFHPQCYKIGPYPGSMDQTKVYCSDCISCKNCCKDLPLLNYANQNEFLNIKGYRVCDDCWKYYKNKHYCPICLKIYKQQNDNVKIYCNKCLNFYHAECENLSPDEVRERQKTKNNYTCSICRMTN